MKVSAYKHRYKKFFNEKKKINRKNKKRINRYKFSQAVEGGFVEKLVTTL